MTEDAIKVLLKSTCPHCEKEILVEVETHAPAVKGILTEDDILSAKEYVVKELQKAKDDKKITEDVFDDSVKWIKDEGTIFGPKDVGSVLESIKN